MNYLDNTSVYRTLWSRLSYGGFSSTQKRYLPFWYQWSYKVLEGLHGGNVGIVAETGAGKTIIAHLVSIARFSRVLFLVPEKVLASQHKELFLAMGADTYSYQIILGDTEWKRRQWNETFYTFSTPQTFLADYNRWKVSMDFDLIIIDEFHKSVGNYAYVFCEHLASLHEIPLLGLSASPGKTVEDIEQLKKRSHIDNLLVVPNPEQEKKRFSYPYTVPLSKELLYIEKQLLSVMGGVLVSLGNLGFRSCFRSSGYLTYKEITILQKTAKKMGKYVYYKAQYYIALYQKLTHILKTALTETYTSVLSYWDGTLAADRSKSGMFLKNHATVAHVISYIRNCDESTHPKVERFAYLMRKGYVAGIVGIVFVNNKVTGYRLKDIATAEGKRVEVITGATSVKQQHFLLGQLAHRDIDVLIATSVIEEGVSVPEVGYIINYSMPLTEISRIQRGGRTGRVGYGAIDYIILDHPLDMSMFHASRRGVETMRASLGMPVEKRKQTSRKRRTASDQYQLL